MADIQSLTEQWEGHTGLEVETFIKSYLSSHEGKYGYLAFSDAPIDNYYHLYAFLNKDDYDSWHAAPDKDDPEIAALLLQDETLFISTVTGDSYSARLQTSLNPTDQITLTDKSLDIPLRYTSVKTSDGDRINAGIAGTLYIQRSNDGVSWATVGTAVIQSRDLDYTGYDNVPVGQYIQEGTQQIRFFATFNYTDAEGATRTATSPYITFTNILYSNMRLTFSAQWQCPFSDGRATIGFFIQGYGQMSLFVKCDDVLVVNGSKVSTYLETPYLVEINNSDLLTNGIHSIEAWLETNDGVGQEDTTVYAKFLYFDESTATDAEKSKTYILVNSLVPTLHPYIEELVMQIAAYKYGSDTVPLTVLFTNSARSQVYFQHDLGNVPTEQVIDYRNALKIPAGVQTAYLYFKVGDSIQTSQYWSVPVDQSIDYSPTQMNSQGFILDPSTRSNNEEHPEVVVNANTGSAVNATWSDGMIFSDPYGYSPDDNGITRLHIPAGESLHITGYDPLGDFINSQTASLTMEFDIRTTNIYDESAPVLTIGSTIQGRILGFEMLPMKAYYCTSQQGAIGAQDIQYGEDERTHIAVNIINNLGGRNLSFVRLFINGIINREFIYSNDDTFVSPQGSGGIRIGSTGADVDIYGIRIYKQGLSSQQVMQDYKSAISDSNRKLAFHQRNNILGGDNTISYELSKMLYSTMLWVADDYTKPYIPNYTNGAGASYSTGTLKVIFRYRYSGNGHNAGDINYDLSRIYTHMKVKGQGTSSMTYWTWNIRFQFSGNSQVFKVNSAMEAAELWLSNVGKPEDEWECYGIFEEGGAEVAKLDAKCNWASSSQSHKMGMMNAYGDLWKQIIGTGSAIYAARSNTRPCVLQEAFLFFVQDAQSNISFHNFMTFGPAKNDKGTYGSKVPSPHYIKDGEQKSIYTLLEGSSNGRPLPEGKVPWIKEEVFYYFNEADDNDSKNETLVYNDDAQFDVDKAPSNTQNEGESNEYDVPKGFTRVPGSNVLWQETTDTEFDTTDIYKVTGGNTIKFYRRAWNLVYRCNPNLVAVEGDYNTFVALQNKDAKCQYFVMNAGAGHAKGDCFRFNPLSDKNPALPRWVNAGIVKNPATTDGYAVLNLFTDLADYMPTSYNPNDAISLANAFITARLALYTDMSSSYWYERDCDMCQAWGKIMAAKDNWCKNTYFKLEPNGLLYMNRDDDDTILDKDNVGKTGTPYQVEEHDRYNNDGIWADENKRGDVWNPATGEYNLVADADNTYWNSQDSILFTLREKTRGTEIRDMVGTIFNTMVSIAGSVDAFYQRYFFDIQEYFPAVAYNEVARLLYEEARIQMSEGHYTNNTDPITQSLGDQLQGEKQWIKRRIPYMESFGHASMFASSRGTGSLSFRSSTIGGESTHSYVFKLKPHQFLYPCAMSESSGAFSNRRARPGEIVVLPPLNVTQNNNIFISGIDFYRSVGDFAEHPTEVNTSMPVVGQRLEEWIINEDGGQTVYNKSTTFTFSCPHLRTLIMRNCSAIGTIESEGLYAMTQLQQIDLRGCSGIVGIALPQTGSLTSIQLPSNLMSLFLQRVPNLETLTLEGYANMQSVRILNGVGRVDAPVDTQNIATGLYDAGADVSVFEMRNINWNSLRAEVLEWLAAISNIALTGSVNIYEPSTLSNAVTFNIKCKLIRKWGNVDDATSQQHQGLLVTYRQRILETLSINGDAYTHTTGNHHYTAVPNNQYCNDFVSLTWGMTTPTQGAEATIDNDGNLNVTKLSSLSGSTQLTLSAVRINGNLVTAPNKTVYLYDRKAQVGDYVFADGTYSDLRDDTKTTVAVCFFVAPDEDEDPLQTIFNRADRQKRLAVAVDNVKAVAQDGTAFNSWQFGMYYNNNGDENSVYKEGPDTGEKSMFTLDTPTNLYDIPTIVNISSGSGSPITDDNFRDTSSPEGVINSGFKPYAAGNAGGDGYAYQEVAAQLSARTLTPELVALAGESYQEGDVVNSGYAKTLKIIQHRNAVLNGFNNQLVKDFPDFVFNIPHKNGNTTELSSLVNEMVSFRAYMASRGEEASAKWSQFFFPAASAAYAFEPTSLRIGETLNSLFKAHNWFLPSSAMLARMYWYHTQGYTVSQQYPEAIFARANEAGKFTAFTASVYWSSTEYSHDYSWYVNFSSGSFGTYGKCYSLYVRPIVAF